jgi:4,5-DOPA dioxygenase extradiol
MAITRNLTDPLPVLFIGHGSPMNMVLENNFTRHLRDLGSSLPQPKAIMVISAHWLTRGTRVNCREKPDIIYDFYGFPDALYQVRYPCSGAPAYARNLVQSPALHTLIHCDETRGLDHASYAILLHMFPKADIPVFELSLDYSFNDWRPKTVQYHYDLARKLHSLRRNGVLIIGSGNIVHNLDRIDADIEAVPYPWAVSIDARIRSCLLERDHESLIHYEAIGKDASLAVPTLDHYLPMIYAIALQDSDDSLRFTFEGFQHGSISMRCFRIG